MENDTNRTLFIPTRSPSFYVRVGWLAALGRPARLIADEMTRAGHSRPHEAYIRTLLRRSGILKGQKAHCLVPLTDIERAWLNYRAEKEGVSPEEWLRRHVVEAVLHVRS
jgi:hypothetical protein